jgi:endoribonuclease Dicer
MADMTLINYIQSRGRARHKSSQFIMLAPQGDHSAQAVLDGIYYFSFSDLKQSEAGLKKSLGNAPQEQQQTDFQSDIKEGEVYKIESTGAFASVYNAIAFLNEFCANLPRDSYYCPTPEFLVAQGRIFMFHLKAPLDMPLKYIYLEV